MSPETKALDRSRPPGVGRPPPLRPPRPERFELSNGLEVLLLDVGELPLVAGALVILGGSSTLAPERAGLSALVADMLDEGTRTRSAVEIAEAVDALGARVRSTSDWDASFVEFDVLSSRVEPTVELVAEIVREPSFDADELERVRRERLTRVLQRRDRPGALADDTLARILYGPTHPYGRPVLGDRETLEALTREEVERYFREHYHAGNAALVLAGDVPRDRLEPLLERTLGRWRTGEAVPLAEERPTGGSEGTLRLLDRPGASQSQIRIGRIAAARTSDDYFPLTVLNTVLGGSFTSRLNTRLREEKGYTYGASSIFVMRRWPGPFVAGASVHTPATGDALKEFVREIRRIREEPVSAEELERARRYAAFRLPQRFESVRDVTARFGEVVLYDLPDRVYESFVDRVLAVDAGAVREVARRHLDPDRLSVVVVGDRERIEEGLRDAWSGRVVLEAGPPGSEAAAEGPGPTDLEPRNGG